MTLKTKRGLFLSIVFSILTLGIYAMYLIHAAAVETNITCAKDGKKTKGFFLYLLFSILTLGIYSWVWDYHVVERWGAFLTAQGKPIRVTGSVYLLWKIVGAFLIGIGYFIAQYLFLHTWDDVNETYNALPKPQ